MAGREPGRRPALRERRRAGRSIPQQPEEVIAHVLPVAHAPLVLLHGRMGLGSQLRVIATRTSHAL